MSKKKQEPKTSKTRSETADEYIYKSFEEWEKKNFPNLSNDREALRVEKRPNLDISDETLKKLRKNSSFDFAF